MLNVDHIILPMMAKKINLVKVNLRRNKVFDDLLPAIEVNESFECRSLESIVLYISPSRLRSQNILINFKSSN